MIHAAHASRFHWSRAEGAESVNLARGEWQCSRVYAVAGPRRAGAVARPALRGHQRGQRHGRLGHRVGVRGDGPSQRGGRRPSRGRRTGRRKPRPRWTASPTRTTGTSSKVTSRRCPEPPAWDTIRGLERRGFYAADEEDPDRRPAVARVRFVSGWCGARAGSPAKRSADGRAPILSEKVGMHSWW